MAHRRRAGSLPPPSESVLDRFLRYVRIDTQSQDGEPVIPSTRGQWDLARLLERELRALGASDVRLSDRCVVYAAIPASTTDLEAAPPVGFIAHVDTSPAVSAANVRPIVHENYQGGDIRLPGDPTQVIGALTAGLADLVGDDVITSDGTTLLGSDDKAGVAAIMTMADVLLTKPGLRHGPVKVAFTPDEEVGVGTAAFDLEAFGARCAYTVDGEALGQLNCETWSARMATLTFHGVSTHPGTAKGVMVNAVYAAADFITRTPAHLRPETTEGRSGFIHPYAASLEVDPSVVKVILRDFEQSGLEAQELLIRELAMETAARHPGVRIDIDVVEQYRNMNDVLQQHPLLMDYAKEATRRAGLTPVVRPVRGGTDGSKLTFRGLPCPNIFTGGHNFHSKQEFNSRRGLEKTTETLLHLVQLFADAPATI